jgi:uncharacterized protein YbaP (TraB family)
MTKRASLAAILAIAAAASCKHGDSSTGGGSGSASGSDPWANPGPGTGSGSGSGSAKGSAIDCPPQPKTTVGPAITAKLTKPFFFHATKSGMANVWLYGTIHLGVTIDAVPDVVLDKLDHAERFAMEADLSDAASLLPAIMRTDHTTLHEELGPVTWHKFACAIGPSVADRLDNMKVSMAATLLDEQGMPEVSTPIDLALFQRAKKAGKGIVFLEKAALQLALLDKWMDARALEAMLDDLADTQKKNLELVDSYVAGDEAKAIEMSKDDSDFIKSGRTHADFAQFMKELLFDRNASWIPEIEDMAKKGDAFVAVGAMHLLGPGSVVDLLEKAGWKVDRVAP